MGALERILGYSFEDEELRDRALTHRSHHSRNNERLEFLGDSILNFVIAQDLFSRFTTAREGQLSRLRARLVRRQTLAEIAREMNLGDYLIMGTGELKSGGYDRDSILADALEAIIGAIYVDSDFEGARRVILDWFDSRLEALSLDKSQKDAKSKLQEFLQGRQANLPEYVVVEVTGKSHDQTFTVECRSELLDEPARAQGTSRRIAEQNAAAIALEMLGVARDPDHA
ncbi:MAG TPA: ribonuclease III [Pseudomonadales bacterium]|nr:ribonuclease III [Pseudomonadales bacterium]